MPHNIALAAAGLNPENGLGVVKAWVESGGDVNGLFDPDATDHGGRDGCHPELNGLAEGGEPLLSLVVGILPIYDEGDCRGYPAIAAAMVRKFRLFRKKPPPEGLVQAENRGKTTPRHRRPGRGLVEGLL